MVLRRNQLGCQVVDKDDVACMMWGMSNVDTDMRAYIPLRLTIIILESLFENIDRTSKDSKISETDGGSSLVKSV